MRKSCGYYVNINREEKLAEKKFFLPVFVFLLMVLMGSDKVDYSLFFLSLFAEMVRCPNLHHYIALNNTKHSMNSYSFKNI